MPAVQLEECYGSTNLILAPLLKALQGLLISEGPHPVAQGQTPPPFLFMLLLFSALYTLISSFMLPAHPTWGWVD